MRVLQEAMRVRPVAATGSTRYTKRGMTVGGFYLPAGTMVDVPFYAVPRLANSLEPRLSPGCPRESRIQSAQKPYTCIAAACGCQCPRSMKEVLWKS